MMKTLAMLALVLVTTNVFAARNWKKNGNDAVDRADTIEEYRALRGKYPFIFIQEIDESKFRSAKVESTGWTYIGSTSCDLNDPRLEAFTFRSTLCMETGLPLPLCTFFASRTPADADPCRN